MSEKIPVTVPHSLRCTNGADHMTISGKVQNMSDTDDLQFVELRGTVLKANGTTVNTDTGYIDSDTPVRNSSSTFTLIINNPNDAGTDCQVQVEGASFK
jgi:hypothetical protein